MILVYLKRAHGSIPLATFWQTIKLNSNNDDENDDDDNHNNKNNFFLIQQIINYYNV